MSSERYCCPLLNPSLQLVGLSSSEDQLFAIEWPPSTSASDLKVCLWEFSTVWREWRKLSEHCVVGLGGITDGDSLASCQEIDKAKGLMVIYAQLDGKLPAVLLTYNIRSGRWIEYTCHDVILEGKFSPLVFCPNLSSVDRYLLMHSSTDSKQITTNFDLVLSSRDTDETNYFGVRLQNTCFAQPSCSYEAVTDNNSRVHSRYPVSVPTFSVHFLSKLSCEQIGLDVLCVENRIQIQRFDDWRTLTVFNLRTLRWQTRFVCWSDEEITKFLAKFPNFPSLQVAAGSSNYIYRVHGQFPFLRLTDTSDCLEWCRTSLSAGHDQSWLLCPDSMPCLGSRNAVYLKLEQPQEGGGNTSQELRQCCLDVVPVEAPSLLVLSLRCLITNFPNLFFRRQSKDVLAALEIPQTLINQHFSCI